MNRLGSMSWISMVLLNLFFIKLSVASETPIPFKADTYSTGTMLSKVFIAMLIVALIAYGISYLIKRYYYGGLLKKTDQENIKLLELKRISPQLTIYRINIDAKQMLLAQTNNSLLVLSENENDTNNEITESEKTL